MLSNNTESTFIPATDHPRRSAGKRLRILCATDLSSRSEAAMRRALQLAQSLEGDALLLHVVDDNAPIRLVGRTAAHALDALKWHAKRLASFRVRPEISVRLGDPKTLIATVARRWRADLIVIGAHRRRRAERVRLSTAERIVRAANLPVLVVNTNSIDDYSGVVFGASNKMASIVDLAHRFEMFQTAHVSVVPFFSSIDRLALATAKLARSCGFNWSTRLRRFVCRKVEARAAKQGLQTLGFEILRDRQSAHELLTSMKHWRGPQLLVVRLERVPFLARSHAQSAATLAVRRGSCDLLLAPARSRPPSIAIEECAMSFG